MNNFDLKNVPDCKLKIICTDSTGILFSQILLKSFFSKLGSAGLNYHLPKLKFFHRPLLSGGYLISIAY